MSKEDIDKHSEHGRDTHDQDLTARGSSTL